MPSFGWRDETTNTSSSTDHYLADVVTVRHMEHGHIRYLISQSSAKHVLLSEAAQRLSWLEAVLQRQGVIMRHVGCTGDAIAQQQSIDFPSGAVWSGDSLYLKSPAGQASLLSIQQIQDCLSACTLPSVAEFCVRLREENKEALQLLETFARLPAPAGAAISVYCYPDGSLIVGPDTDDQAVWWDVYADEASLRRAVLSQLEEEE